LTFFMFCSKIVKKGNVKYSFNLLLGGYSDGCKLEPFSATLRAKNPQ
jgi:hypothetical protein